MTVSESRIERSISGIKIIIGSAIQIPTTLKLGWAKSDPGLVHQIFQENHQRRASIPLDLRWYDHVRIGQRFKSVLAREYYLAVNERIGKPSRLTATGWALLTFFAVVNGLEGLRYALPHVPFPMPLPNFLARREWLIVHAIFSSLALLTGPWQFLSSFRSRWLTAHRWMGRFYCATVTAGWLTSLPIAAHAQTGRVASSGFLALGAAWISTTALGYRAIRLGHVQTHREWMIRSYALTAAAITLRMYLPIVIVTRAPFAAGYALVAWICWIPNLLFAEWLVRRGRTRTAADTLAARDLRGWPAS